MAISIGHRESLRREELRQGQAGEIATEVEEQKEAKQETVSSGEATDVDHFDLAHGAADAMDMENRSIHVERKATSDGHAEKRKLPGKHAVLCRCGFCGIRILERDSE